MLKITLEGPQGCGKTRVAQAIVEWAIENDYCTLSVDAGKEHEVVNFPQTDILIIEKQTCS